jgi:hypothetical protein
MKSCPKMDKNSLKNITAIPANTSAKKVGEIVSISVKWGKVI